MPTRRSFLARIGVLSAGLAVAGPARALAGPLDPVLATGQQLILPTLHRLAEDTFAGVAALVIPGPDPYSVQQGQADSSDGAVAARAHTFLIGAVDRYLPYPDALLRPLAHHLLTATADSPLPDGLAGAADELVRALDDGLGMVLANDQHIPLSTLFTLLLSHLATEVDPVGALDGPFPAPFANLDMTGKAAVIQLLESDRSGLVAELDGELDEPARRSLSGLLAFIGNALVTFTAFGTFSEFSAVDLDTGQVMGRPLGWTLSGFSPGEQVPADGWDELKGYLGGRRVAEGARTWPTARADEETASA